MSVFGSIMSKIFGPKSASAEPAAGAASEAAAPPTPGGTSTATVAAPAIVDVEVVLTELSTKAGQPLDWRHSIVDLMKLLGLDSSLAARKELAQELKYSGDPNDSAPMNIWLHKQVMVKLAENGGKVPDELKG